MPARDAVPPVTWRKSSRSGANGDCVEVAVLSKAVAVRDSKDPDGPQLRFTARQWRAFLDAVKQGEFERPARRSGAASRT